MSKLFYVRVLQFSLADVSDDGERLEPSGQEAETVNIVSAAAFVAHTPVIYIYI